MGLCLSVPYIHTLLLEVINGLIDWLIDILEAGVTRAAVSTLLYLHPPVSQLQLPLDASTCSTASTHMYMEFPPFLPPAPSKVHRTHEGPGKDSSMLFHRSVKWLGHVRHGCLPFLTSYCIYSKWWWCELSQTVCRAVVLDWQQLLKFALLDPVTRSRQQWRHKDMGNMQAEIVITVQRLHRLQNL